MIELILPTFDHPFGFLSLFLSPHKSNLLNRKFLFEQSVESWCQVSTVRTPAGYPLRERRTGHSSWSPRRFLRGEWFTYVNPLETLTLEKSKITVSQFSSIFIETRTICNFKTNQKIHLYTEFTYILLKIVNFYLSFSSFIEIICNFKIN